MILRVKKRTLQIAFLTLFLITVLPIIAADVTHSFQVRLSIGDAAPVIFFVNNSVETPAENGTITANIYFNASDTNGFGTLNGTSAQVRLNWSSTVRTGTCSAYANYSPSTTEYNCTVTFNYYDPSGAWSINASVSDNSGNEAVNLTSGTFTYNPLSAMRIVNESIHFGQVTLGATSGAAGNPLELNNTGNVDFTAVNITAYDLKGTTDGSEYIDANNFSVNATDDSRGIVLTNETSTLITTDGLTALTLSYGAPGGASNASLYLYVTLPASGLSAQTFNSTAWTITVS